MIEAKSKRSNGVEATLVIESKPVVTEKEIEYMPVLFQG